MDTKISRKMKLKRLPIFRVFLSFLGIVTALSSSLSNDDHQNKEDENEKNTDTSKYVIHCVVRPSYWVYYRL